MTFKTRVIAGFGASLALLICVGVLSYWSVVQNANERQWVNHTHLVLEKLDALSANLIDAETGERGYLLTGEESYLAPYNGAASKFHENLKDLRELTADNPRQQRALNRLESVTERRFALLKHAIEIRKQGGLAAGADFIAEGSGKREMDEARMEIAAMREEEGSLLQQRSRGVERTSSRTRVVIVSGNALALLLLSLAGVIVQREMGQRKNAEDRVRSLNVDLERRVDDRTAELAERMKDLARSNSELQQFAYVASHDLQEPLRMVASFTQLLGRRYKEKLDDDARDFINYAVDGATRMQTLITDLLSYSRVGTQGKPLESTRCDDVLDRVLNQNLSLAIKESGVVITRDPLPTVMADPLQLGQLFQNLIANAIKFRGKDRPSVQIFAERRNADWEISVCDNGIGISQEHADRIFIIFQRLHTKTEYPGTGIGLAICKKIAERHGGRIWVEQTPGGGSTFRFTIPSRQFSQLQRREHDELRVPASIS
ncbi:MAG TPA: CHASE3 domain-containing protein [Candidatus Acidoferrales bacterium]